MYVLGTASGAGAAMGFIRGAKTDSRYDRKQAAELGQLTTPVILSQPVDLQKVSVAALQGWLDWRVQELLGGVEDEILSGMIGNVLAEEQAKLTKMKGARRTGWSPKELQHTLGPFLTPEMAAKFMEELWILLLDAQESADGIPQAWGPTERAQFMSEVVPQKDNVNKVASEKKDRVVLGAGPSMRLRSPERVIGRMIEEERRRDRYFDNNRREDRHERGREHVDVYDGDRRRERERRPMSPSRSPRPRRSRSPRRHSPHRRRFESSPSRSPSLRRSRSTARREERRSRRREYEKEPVRYREASSDTFSSSQSRSPVRNKSRSPVRSRSRSRSKSPVKSEDEKRRKKNHHKKKKKHHHHHRRKRSPSRHSEESGSDGEEMDQLEAALRQKALESMRTH